MLVCVIYKKEWQHNSRAKKDETME